METVKIDYTREGQDSVQLTEDDIAVVRLLKILGFHNKRIAALFDVNQGRISEAIRTNGIAHTKK